MKAFLPADIDEFGALDAELGPKNARHTFLRKQFLAPYDSEAANQAFTAEGELYVLAIGEKANKRTYKPTAMRRLAAFLSLKTFYSLCSLTLGKFDENVPAGVQHRFVDEAQEGARTIKVIAKSSVTMELKAA